MADDELLTATKMAKELGISTAKVKKAIETLGLEPAKVRCGCKYYARADAEKIEKAAP